LDQAGTGATGDEEAKAGENSSGVEIIVPGDSQGLPLDTSHKSIQAFKTAHCVFFFGGCKFSLPALEAAANPRGFERKCC